MKMMESGELLVRYQLSKVGIKSAKINAGDGADIVAFTVNKQKPLTIKVKTQEKPIHTKGQARQSLKWSVEVGTKADVIALVDISRDKLWLFEDHEFKRHARAYQNHHTLKLNLYDDDIALKRYSDFLAENRIEGMFLD